MRKVVEKNEKKKKKVTYRATLRELKKVNKTYSKKVFKKASEIKVYFEFPFMFLIFIYKVIFLL